MKRFLKINPLFFLPLILLLTTSILLYGLKTLSDRDAADQKVIRSNTVIATIDQVELAVINMETGFRGYMLTGRDSFLEPYQSGKGQFDASIKKLMALTVDNHFQQDIWKEVQAQEAQWDQEWVINGLQIRRDVSAGKASETDISKYILTEGGKKTIDAIRVKLEQGKQDEADLLDQRMQAQRLANNWAYGVMFVGIVLSVLLGLSTGVFLSRVQNRNMEQIELQQLLLNEREKERMEIARDIHDGPIQNLIAMIFSLGELSQLELGQEAADRLDILKTSLNNTLAELRSYAMNLRSPVLVEFGLEKAMRAYLEKVQEQHPELTIHFEAKQTGDLLPDAYRNALFRIFQESMNNIIRHSQATQIEIFFKKQAGRVLLEIRDNGVGFVPPSDWVSMARHGHLGLVGIRERAQAIGGQVEIDSHPRKGTCLRVSVKLTEGVSPVQTHRQTL